VLNPKAQNTTIKRLYKSCLPSTTNSLTQRSARRSYDRWLI